MNEEVSTVLRHVEELGELLGLVAVIITIIIVSARFGRKILARLDLFMITNAKDHETIKKDARRTRQTVDHMHGELVIQGKEIAKLQGKVESTCHPDVEA